MKKKYYLTIPLLAIGLISSGTVNAATTGVSPEPPSRDTPVTAKLTVNGSNPMPPDPSTNGPKPTDPGAPKGPFGISYAPIAFSTKETALQESAGDQTIPFETPQSSGKSESFHVGVKDKTRGQQGWTLTATYNASTSPTVNTPTGCSIKFENKSSTPIKINNGNSTAANLEEVPEVGSPAAPPITTSSTTSGGIISLKNGVASEVMTAKDLSGTDSYNGVYDYALGDASISIPNASQQKAGNYSLGEVTWNLAVVVP